MRGRGRAGASTCVRDSSIEYPRARTVLDRDRSNAFEHRFRGRGGNPRTGAAWRKSFSSARARREKLSTRKNGRMSPSGAETAFGVVGGTASDRHLGRRAYSHCADASDSGDLLLAQDESRSATSRVIFGTSARAATHSVPTPFQKKNSSELVARCHSRRTRQRSVTSH
jgi:hypothetical protein